MISRKTIRIIHIADMLIIGLFLTGCAVSDTPKPPVPSGMPAPASSSVPTEPLLPASTDIPDISDSSVPTEAPIPTEDFVPTEPPVSTDVPVPTDTPVPAEPFTDPIDEYVSLMTVEEKVRQLFIVEPEAVQNSSETDRTLNGSIGGYIFFAGHLTDPEQTESMLYRYTEECRAATRKMLSDGTEMSFAPFLSVDEEGGTIVARIAKNPAFDVPKVNNMCDIETAEDAYDVGETISGYLRELGFNLDFAPVADTITNPLNSIIGKRSFGTDPYDVDAKAAAVVRGLHSGHIFSCYKHFPGHGSTEGDSHLGLAFTNDSLEELMKDDLIPFMHASEAGTDMVMVAHISVPGVLGDNTPCSLSKYMMTDVLRGVCGFDGIVITDALNMGAIVQNYGADEAAVTAFTAGADILLMPDNFDTAVRAVTAAVYDGTITEDRLNKSVKRILKLKQQITTSD